MKRKTVLSVFVGSLIFAGQLRAGTVFAQPTQEKTAALEVGERVVAMALNSDGTRLVTGSWEGAVRLWDLRTGKQIRTFKGHADMITAAALSRDSKRLVTASLDGTARLWAVASGEVIRVYPAGEKGQACLAAIDSEAKWMVASVGPIAKLWDLDTGKVVRLHSANGLTGFRPNYLPSKAIKRLRKRPCPGRAGGGVLARLGAPHHESVGVR